MLLTNWYKALSLFLWITPQVLLGVVAVVFYKRRLYREFPFFFAYVLYEIAGFLMLFALYSVLGLTSAAYAYAFSIQLVLSVALRFGVIDEVSRDLFRDSEFLKTTARRSLQGVTGLLVVIGILLAVYAPGDSSVKWHAGISVVNRGAAVVQCGLLLSLLLFSRFVGVSWRRPAFGIALGLALLTSVDVAASALRVDFSSDVSRGILNLVITSASLVCVSIWIRYLVAPEPKPASVTVVSRDEAETWNRELQQWLSH
jgi:hypothetical protein